MNVAERRLALRRLLAEQVVARQSDLVDLLTDRGYRVTQSTVSRDLVAIGGRRVALPNGSFRYVVGEAPSVDPATLSSTLARYVVEIATSGNLVVLRTPSGAAHLVASAMDGASVHGVIATLAGEDTVLVVTGDGVGAPEVAAALEEMGLRARRG
jgi:transcriptional regulator of arginine metabolism